MAYPQKKKTQFSAAVEITQQNSYWRKVLGIKYLVFRKIIITDLGIVYLEGIVPSDPPEFELCCSQFCVVAPGFIKTYFRHDSII
jgi:hypothetical protein